MSFSDSEGGKKDLEAPRYPVLQYLHHLSTRKLVFLVAAAVLVPGWFTISYIDGLSYVTDDVDDVQLGTVGHDAQSLESTDIKSHKNVDEKVDPSASQTIEVVVSESATKVENALRSETDADVPSHTESDTSVNTSKTEDTGEDDDNDPVEEHKGPTDDENREQKDEGKPKSKEQQKPNNADDLGDNDEEDLNTIPVPPPLPLDAPELPPPPPPVEEHVPLMEEHKTPAKQPEQGGVADIPTPPDGTHRMVIIVPLDSPNPNLCKTMFSGMANGYPSPVIVNWGNEGDRPYGGKDKSHLLKITKTLEYLDHMMSDKAHPDDKLDPNDLVVLTDALDIWWQLPPEVFIKRYHESNRQADERLAKEWGMTGKMPTRQKIVAAAQKRCWPTPEMGIDLHCDILPKNPMRPDLYGENTDIGEEPRNWRVRSINSGTIVGPAKDFRRYLRRAQDRMSRVHSVRPSLVSDQGLLGEVWGEQEVVRNWLRALPNKADKDFIEDPATKMILENYEYYFGLDYTQQLVISTVFEEIEGEILRLNNQSYIDKMSAKLGINPVRLHGVPKDVKNVQTPLKKYLPDIQTPDWGDLPLYADFFTEAVPVILHNNAHRDGLKGRRQWWWDRTWYFPYLRTLVRKYQQRPQELPVLGTYTIGDKVVKYKALPSEKVKRKPRRFSVDMVEKGLPVMEFEDVCRGRVGETKWFDEVFRDGQGPF